MVSIQKRVPAILGYFSICCFCVVFSSCFELQETLYLKKDQSGTYTSLLHLHQGVNTAASPLDSIQQNVFLAGIENSLTRGLAQLNELEGISKAQVLIDKKEQKLGFTFHFKDIETLNRTLSHLIKSEKTQVFFSFRGKTFVREPVFPFESLVNLERSEQHEKEYLQSVALRKELLQQASYHFILKTEGRIRKFNDTFAEQKDENRLVLQGAFLQIVEQPERLSQEVRIK